MTLPVYVLVGGESRRFGADKASFLVDGEPWALHVGRRLSDRHEGGVILVGHREPPKSLAPLPCLADAEGAAGPVAGLLAALRDRAERFGEGLLTLASCDLVRPEPAWLGPLCDAHTADETLEAAAYRAADRWQPFPSVVHTRWRETLDPACRSLQAALSAARATALPWPGEAGGPPQANTPEELSRLLVK